MVECSLGRQGRANSRAKGLKVGAAQSTEGCHGQVEGFWAVLGQFAASFRVISWGIYLAFCISSVSFWGLDGARVVGCLVLYAEAWRRRQEGKRSQGHSHRGGLEWCQGQVASLWAVFGQLGDIFG